jgi:hypothetical protein
MLWALGCNVYDPGLMEDGPAGVPDRPPAGTSSSADEGSLLFALEDIYIRQSAEMAARTGLDLDGTVTASRAEATCEPRVTEGGETMPMSPPRSPRRSQARVRILRSWDSAPMIP